MSNPLRHLLALMVSFSGAANAADDPWDRVPPPAESLFKAHVDLDEAGQSRLSFGGHARSMFEYYRNRDFGFAPIRDDAWVHHRVQVFGVWQEGDDFKLMTELTWGEMQGMRNEQSPPDEDQLDLLQLYAQARLELGARSSLVLRAGRQTLYYGSGRLLAHREGANQRLVHDALRLSWRMPDWNVDAILASPVRIGPGEFDNASYFQRTLLWGLYATGPSVFGEGHGMDIYYLGRRLDSSPLSDGQQEIRHTFGTRLFGKEGPWSYNHEFILQTGDVADRDILAGAVSLGLGHTWKDQLFQPTLGFRGDLISGGQGSGEINTFDPLFQANNYFNEGGFVSPSNLYNLNPRLSLQLTKSLSLDLGVNFLWRFDTGDAVYTPPFNAVAGAAPNGERYLGTAYNAALAWDPHSSFDLSIGFTHHEAGPSLTSVGGRSVDYLQIAARIEF
ncbi:alginate export family protein [Brevifollis gellanilyticus]|nr:alginate export family protein [Brevifollis gellanilyticus]